MKTNTETAMLSIHLLSMHHNYQKSSYILQNRADFWALAGIAAVDKGIENANEDCDSDDCAVPDSGLTFQWGRQVSDNILSKSPFHCTCSPLKDCSTSPDTTDDVGLPSSLLDHDGVMDFFATGERGKSYHKKIAFRLKLSALWWDTKPTTAYAGLFATEFGFDENQTVALLGAHTLGGVSIAH